MSNPYETALTHWQASGIALIPPYTPQEVELFFSGRLGFPLSQDVVRLYSTLGGFADYSMVDHLSLWSLEQVLEGNESNPTPHLWFADYLIHSIRYAFDYRSFEYSAVMIDCGGSESEPLEVAESVEEFLHKFMTDPDSVEAFAHDVPYGTTRESPSVEFLTGSWLARFWRGLRDW